jgi:hypothetical protein
MPYVNSGTFAAGAQELHVRRAGVFREGNAVSSAAGTYFEAPLTLEGTNNATGPGFMNMMSAPLAFAAGAKMNAERIAFRGTSSASGGELQVSKAANFSPQTGQTSLIDATQVRLLAGSTNSAAVSQGTVRLQNGAALRNAGSFNIDRSVRVELNSGAVLENAGTLTTTSPGAGPSFFTGDGTGIFRTLTGSVTRFNYSGDPNQHFVNVPFDMAGQFYADPGAHAVFDRGGLLNETAKIWPNVPAPPSPSPARLPFNHADARSSSQGTGSVHFLNTTLEFLPSTLSSTGNGQLDETIIHAGARVTFSGASTGSNLNTVKSSQALLDLARQGTLSTTGFVFASGDVDRGQRHLGDIRHCRRLGLECYRPQADAAEQREVH